jgi:hypothetical protein
MTLMSDVPLVRACLPVSARCILQGMGCYAPRNRRLKDLREQYLEKLMEAARVNGEIAELALAIEMAERREVVRELRTARSSEA